MTQATEGTPSVAPSQGPLAERHRRPRSAGIALSPACGYYVKDVARPGPARTARRIL